MTVTVTGITELHQVFANYKRSIANRIARPALAKAASFGAKKVKAAIPSRYKSVRKAIGWRTLKARFNDNYAGTKIGAGVGKMTKARRARAEKNQAPRKGKGVGISGNNVHWWFLGTGQRRLEKGSDRGPKAGHPTGQMKPQEKPVESLLAPHMGEIKTLMAAEIKKQIEKESKRKK